MEQKILAEKVARLLAGRKWILGTVECGVKGVVSHQIFDTPHGPTVLGNSLIVDSVTEAIGLLDLPRSQFKKAGYFSLKAARAAAREGRTFLRANLCLVVWTPSDDDDSKEWQSAHIALNTGSQALSRTIHYERSDEQATAQLIVQALDMMQQALSWS